MNIMPLRRAFVFRLYHITAFHLYDCQNFVARSQPRVSLDPHCSRPTGYDHIYAPQEPPMIAKQAFRIEETAAIQFRRQRLRRVRWLWLLLAIVAYALWDIIDQDVLVVFDPIIGGYLIDWSLFILVGTVFMLAISRHQDQSLAQLETQISRTLAAERAVLESVIEQAAARTEAVAATERYKSALLAAVSHDFRTPLGIVTAATDELLADDVRWSPAATHEFARVIRTEAERLTRLVTNLLDMTQIEAGAVRLQRGWYNLAEIVHRVLSRFGADLEERPFTLDLPDDLPLVPVDYVQIEQVIWNLVQNALKYSPSDSPLAVGVAVQELWLELSIADHGPGIPDAEREQVFAPFYRVSQNNAEAIRGTGIGLAICKGLVEAHGGRIQIGANEPSGSIVRVLLPRHIPSTTSPTQGANNAIAPHSGY